MLSLLFLLCLSIRVPEDFITDFSSVVFGSRYVEMSSSKFRHIVQVVFLCVLLREKSSHYHE